MDEESKNEQWATVEIMGHVQTAGRISRPSEWAGLLRVDVPLGDSYRTEFYGMQAIYSVKLVSEEIARAYAQNYSEPALDYNTPIVSKNQFDEMRHKAEQENYRLRTHIRELENRLTAVNALPAGDDGDEEDERR